jgi:tetratricopeptide (TPR) repeat protein
MSVIDLNMLPDEDEEIELEPQTEERISKDDYSVQMFQDAVDKEPLNYWLWRNLCTRHAMTNNLDEAIHICELGAKKSDANPSPLMELTNLYAAKGDYKAAIETGMQLLKMKSAILLLALKDSKDPLITRTSCDNKLRSSLQR